MSQFSDEGLYPDIKSLKVEAAIRPRSGGAGINISFKEEDEGGQGCLFRIDNCSPFPVWFAQDGLLANPMSFSIFWINASIGDFLKFVIESIAKEESLLA